MESAAVEPRSTVVSGLLGVPGSIAWDGDETKDAEVINGIRPKSSPLPRRRSDSDLNDFELELTPCRSRRVSFADALGLNLVKVKEFDSWDVTMPVSLDTLVGEKEADEYYLSSLYTPPLSEEALVLRVQEQKLELESTELLRGTTILRGVIRVLNVSFDKMVYVRTTLDAWATHFDLLAEYVPWSSDGHTERFSFKLTLVPPFRECGARVDFCLRYETSAGTFWANNSGQNYVMFCQLQNRELKAKPQKHKNGRRKSILKAIGQDLPCENQSPTNAESSDVHYNEKEMANVNLSETKTGTTQDYPDKLLVESSLNFSGRKQRKAAKMAQARDYFTQRDNEAQEKEKGTITDEPLQTPQECTLQQEHPPQVQPLPPQRRRRAGLQVTPVSQDTYNKLCTGAQDSLSREESGKSENIDSTNSSALSELNGKQVTPVLSRQSDSADQLTAPRLTDDMSVGVEENAQMQLEMEKVRPIISKDETNSHKTVSYTFGNVVAPLYHQAFGGMENDDQTVNNGVNQIRVRLHVRDPIVPRTQSIQSAEEVETHSCVSAGTWGTPEEKPMNQPESLESFLEHLPSGLSEDESEPEPLLEQSRGLFRIHSPINTNAAVLVSSEDSKVQGSEENVHSSQNQICQDNNILQTNPTHSQTSLDPTHSQTSLDPTHSQTSLDPTHSQTSLDPTHSQTSLDPTHLQTQTLIVVSKDTFSKSLTEMGLKLIPAKLTLPSANDGYEKPAESGEMKNPTSANVDEWSPGIKLVADLEVFNSATEADVNITANNQNIAAPRLDKLEDTNEITLKEESNEINKLTSLEKSVIRKPTDQVEDELSFEVSSTLFNEPKKHCIDNEESEALRETTNDDRGKYTEKVSNSKYNIPKDELKRNNKEDLICTENEIEARSEQQMLKKNRIEKDWEEIVQEEEMMMMFGEVQDKEMVEEMVKKQQMEELEEDVKWQLREEVVVVKESKKAEADVEGIVDVQNELLGKLCMQMDTDYDDEGGLSTKVNVFEKSDSEKYTLKAREVFNPSHTDIITDVTHHGDAEMDSNNGDMESCIQTDEHAIDKEGEGEGEEDNTSTDSLSDEEITLYMCSLRAVQRQQSKDVALAIGKRPSIGRRGSRPSMPSISESGDEDLLSNQDDLPDKDKVECLSASTLPLVVGEQDTTRASIMWLKEKCSWHNVSRGLLYIILLVVFFLVAYHYDFLACFCLYLLSVIWLFCQGQKLPMSENN